MTTPHTFANVFAYCLIFVSFAVIPMFFYISYLLFKYHTEMYFLKRGLIFLLPQLILAFILLVVVRPMLVAVEFLNYNFISIELIRSFNSLLLFGITNIEIARVGYYFVQIHRVTQATVVASHDQSSFITIKNADSMNSKNICTKNILHFISSQTRMFILVLIFWLLESAIDIAMIDNLIIKDTNGINRLISIIVACVVGVSYAIVIFIAARNKVFQFEDNWYITQEFRKIGKIIAYHVLIGALLLVTEMLIPANNEEMIIIVQLCFVPFYLSLGICFCYITYIWVWKVNEANANHTRKQVSLKLNNDTPLPSESNDSEVKKDGGTVDTHKIELTSNSQARPSYRLSESKHAQGRKGMGTHSSKVAMNNYKLDNFWNEKFDVKTDYTNIKDEFVKFSNHCVSELNIENLLFFVNCVQLLEFLIEKKYFDVNGDDDAKNSNITPMIYSWSVSHFIKDTNAITKLKKAYDLFHSDKNINYNSNININYNKDLDFSIFGGYYVDIYERFLQRHSAPFEINIAHQPRQRFEEYYHDIHTNGVVVTKEYFDTIWKDLKHAAIHVYSLLDHPFNRFAAQNCQ